MKFISTVILLGSLLATISIAQGQTPDSARVMVCATPYPVTASANTGAGYINFCVYYPEAVQPGETFSVNSILTAPATIVPAFITAAQAFTANFGCTEGTPAVAIPTTNGVVGTQWTALTTFTLSAASERCDFLASAGLTVAAVPLQIYSTGIMLNIRTENTRIDNFNYLCDAPGIAPNSYGTTTTTCNDPNLALTGTITCIDCDDTINIGNTTVNVLVNNTVGNGTSGNTTTEPGFDGSLYVLLTAIGIAFAHLATIHRTNGGRIIAGGFLFAASLAIFRELERLGFTHMGESTIDMALLIMSIQWIAAIYLFIPKHYEEKETNQ